MILRARPPIDPRALLLAVLAVLAFLAVLFHAWARAADVAPKPPTAQCTQCPCGCTDLPDTCRCTWTLRGNPS